MTLKEKFDVISCKDCDMPYCDRKCTILSDRELNVLELVADEFAIGFAEWIDTKYYQGEQENEYHKSIKEYREGKFFNIKELLEIYKKEKGL